ncbi:MAG: hypothetical protein WBG76_13385 [Ornithinimicrobium sp.]
MSTTEAPDQMPANAMAFSQRLSGPRMRRPSPQAPDGDRHTGGRRVT